MNKKADLARVAAAFTLPLVLVAVAGWIAWSETWARAEGELFRTADGAAEYAQRVVSSALLAGRLTNSILAGASDDLIRSNEARYHERLSEIMPELPGSNTITVSDRDGTLLLMSTQYPVPPISVADREWVKVLQSPEAPELHVGSLSVGRVRGNLFFGISIPRTGSSNGGSPGAYDGLINVALDPHIIAAGLSTTTHESADVITLLRADGEILSSTRGVRPDIPRVPQTSPLFAAIAAGETRGMYEGAVLGLRDTLPLGMGLSIAFRQVGDFPVYVTVSRPPSAIIAQWYRTMAGLLAVGLPTSIALGMLSLTGMRRKNALLASEAESRAAFENAAVGTALVDGTTDRILKVNKRLCDISGRRSAELVGMTQGQLLIVGKGGDEDATDVMTGLDKLQRPDGTVRWIERATALVTPTRDDAPALVIATLHDVTERKESQERQILLAREVDHRAKNVLAIVQAVIRLAREPGAESFVEKVEGRIRALARAHELLARDRRQGARLMELVREELAAYQDGAQVTIRGPEVRIVPSSVQPLSMALHELATNAVKHGALGRPGGRLSITWCYPTSDRLNLVWKEQAEPGPQVRTGTGGTGLKILQGSVAQLGGEIALDWRATGLSCSIELPMTVLATQAGSTDGDRNVADGNDKPPTKSDLAGKRILLVEDEVLVAMDLQEMLERIGCKVIGPARTIDAARLLLAQEAGRIDLAVLDFNLSGATSLQLARDLSRAGVACIFVTGYSDLEGIADDEDWLLLRKPVGEAEVMEALQVAFGATDDATEALAKTARPELDPFTLTLAGTPRSKTVL